MRGHGEPKQHGKPHTVGEREAQLDAREGQARRYEVADRPVGVRKPGNAGGAKGPEFKADVSRGKSQEIGHEPRNSGNGSEATDDVTCQSEGLA